VLSHPEQLDRLKRACPAAAEVAVIAGDPCYDRMLISRSRRAQLRRDLGVAPGQKLVVVSSTWAEESLLGARFGLLDRLLAELPLDEYRVAAVPHPNIWHLHGRYTVRSWLAAHRRSGLIVPPPLEGWRALIVAADAVIGDHGSVTFYAAALGVPTIMGTFPAAAVAPDSPVARLGATAPRLNPARPLRPQLEHVMATHDPARYAAITDAVTAVPGESGRLLRDAMYDLLGLAPPSSWAVPAPVPAVALPAGPVTATWTTVAWDGFGFTVERHPAWLDHDRSRPDGAHLVVDAAEPGLLQMADVIVERDPIGSPYALIAEAMRRYGCLVAAVQHRTDGCLAGVRDGPTVEFTSAGGDPAIAASMLHDWVSAGRPVERLPRTVQVRRGTETECWETSITE
jgi:hypothetical protein